ncbi:MAG: methylated-DNA-protein-cysteine methyltransferase related protein [Actinomycetota bacterium]|jgi:methylated-DNA-protein-cysteine methyltransferase-like protein|nr:methylated-DNA-protein-cysteine methyltransferase related protein [Actinomycetota bacterium]
MPTFEDQVSRAIRALRPGEVATYGEIAQEAGFPGAARAVGNVLAGSEGLPWWRVIHADGSLVTHNRVEQERRLKAEGVQITNGRVRVVRSKS